MQPGMAVGSDADGQQRDRATSPPPPQARQRPGGERRNCGSAIRRRNRRRRGPRPRRATDRHRTRRCPPARRRRPASPRRPAVAARPQQRDNSGLVTREQVENSRRWLRGGLQRQVVAVDARASMPASRAAFRAWAALIAVPSSPLIFPARIGAGDLRPHRPHRSRRWISTGWRGRSTPLPAAEPSASSATVRRSGAAKPLAGLAFGG